MPTGYTADIDKGITFKQFALSCARNFGALITMRDDPHDAEIPDEFTPDTDHYDEALAKAEARFVELASMTEAQAAEKAEAEYREGLRAAADRNAERQALRDKYEAMLLKVEQWTPPTPDHAGLKRFMREQITESIRFDCGYVTPDPVLASPQEYIRAHKEQAIKDVEYYTQERQKEIERAAERTAWVKALRASLASE